MLSRAVSSVGQSTSLTPRGSLVRAQYRPPHVARHIDGCRGCRPQSRQDVRVVSSVIAMLAWPRRSETIFGWMVQEQARLGVPQIMSADMPNVGDIQHARHEHAAALAATDVRAVGQRPARRAFRRWRLSSCRSKPPFYVCESQAKGLGAAVVGELVLASCDAGFWTSDSSTHGLRSMCPFAAVRTRCPRRPNKTTRHPGRPSP